MRPRFDIKSITFVMFFISLVSLAVINNVAVKFYLYWQYLWLDIPIHFLGGVVVALGVLSVFAFHEEYTFVRGLVHTLAFVCIVGLLWEAFEFTAGIPIIEKNAVVADTILDLIMDVVGGFVGYLLAWTLRPFDRGVHWPENV